MNDYNPQMQEIFKDIHICTTLFSCRNFNYLDFEVKQCSGPITEQSSVQIRRINTWCVTHIKLYIVRILELNMHGVFLDSCVQISIFRMAAYLDRQLVILINNMAIKPLGFTWMWAKRYTLKTKHHICATVEDHFLTTSIIKMTKL